jgi:predicted Zn finger-like uncharacterized protein
MACQGQGTSRRTYLKVPTSIIQRRDVSCLVAASAIYNCPHCRAPYQVVKAEAGPETVDHAVPCCSCGEPLPVAKVSSC